MTNNMAVFNQLNNPETVEVTAEQLAEVSAEHEQKRQEVEHLGFLEQMYNMSPRSVKRKLRPERKFSNQLLKAFQAKNKK